MVDLQLPIPDEYKSQLRYVKARDQRSDAKIIESLSERMPITSEKNIWTYWHSGVRSMPSWCQRNIINWVRLHGSEWTVRVLDTVPDSPNHALTWIVPEELPESFVKGTMTGPYVGPHSADFLRGATLYAYGGAWMDVGNILFRHLDDVCWKQLADETSPYTVATPLIFGHYTANHFVASRKGDIFIKNWHAIFMELWKDRDDFTGVIESPLVAFIQNMSFSQAKERGYSWDFKVDQLTIMGYIGQVIAWIRLTWLQEPNGGFDGVEYWAKKVLLWDASSESWAGERIVGYKGEDLFRVFTMRTDADPDGEKYKKAEKTAWRMLTQSTMQKITHGKDLTHSLHCGVLMDLPENEGNDAEPGTFGELLRHGSVHLEQTREKIVYVDPPIVPSEFIIHKGLLEV
ncbi:hypothetical protein EJ02DRAFT_474006 [Clathrospora elynae]|uniref:Capsule polysaccharide biosynthesis protein n=1 Tax=Clathrospora elynae TaxID=706981 RepID=A0A6A5SEQ2_9PLEO|nr:hypothetical protein EJ02DRAFT_474006 [Clathrospora elynae]